MGDFFDRLREDEDKLKSLPVNEVATWYARLATFIEQTNNKVKEPLAPRLLRHWLKGGGKKLTFSAPEHLRNSKFVVDVLKEHRVWYLTQERFKGQWVGIVPRLQGKPPHPKWDAKVTIPFMMNLQSLVEVPTNKLRTHSPEHLDLLTALHGFQLRTDVMVLISEIQGQPRLKVDFLLFLAKVMDRYDFDPDEYFIVPNPDYRNRYKVANPVAPDRDQVAVFHRNAKRLVDAGKAFDYDLESEPFAILDLAIMGPGKVDPGKKI